MKLSILLVANVDFGLVMTNVPMALLAQGLAMFTIVVLSILLTDSSILLILCGQMPKLSMTTSLWCWLIRCRLFLLLLTVMLLAVN